VQEVFFLLLRPLVECDVCLKIFPYEMNRSLHVCKGIDPSNDPLICPVCKRSFSCAATTTLHFQARHKDYKGRIECDVCSKIFPSHIAHCKHVCGEVDPSNNPLICPACKRFFLVLRPLHCIFKHGIRIMKESTNVMFV